MTEEDFLTLVTDLAMDMNITWMHIPDSRKIPSAKGLPDLFLVGSFSCIWRELKLSGQGLRSDQVTWRYKLIAAGQDHGIWYPADYYSGIIESELRQLNHIRMAA